MNYALGKRLNILKGLGKRLQKILTRKILAPWVSRKLATWYLKQNKLFFLTIVLACDTDGNGNISTQCNLEVM